MILVCVNAFGRFEPGDEITVPDGAVFDTLHFEAKGDEVAADKENG